MDYANIANVTTKILSRFGAPLKVTRGGAVVGTGYGIFDEQKSGYETTEQFQTAVTKKTIVASKLAKTPQVGDIVTFLKTNYTVSGVAVTSPTGTDVLYTLEVTYG